MLYIRHGLKCHHKILGTSLKLVSLLRNFHPAGMTNHVRNQVPISGDGRLRYGFGAEIAPFNAGTDQRVDENRVREGKWAQARYSLRPVCLVVVLQTQMGDQIFATEISQSVLQLHQLDKDIMLGIKAGRGLRRLEIEGQPFLDTLHSRALG